MYKIITFFLLFLMSGFAVADRYGGAGAGLSEACVTKYQPSFAGGDCINPNIDIRGFMGTELGEYFAFEGSVDFSFDAGNIADAILSKNDDESFFYDPDIQTKRWSILTFAIHPLVSIPVMNSVRVFAGPSFGGSVVTFDYDVKYFGNTQSSSNSTTAFGWNYGWTAGVDLFTTRDSAVRLQWQNWRSLDADVATATHREFNSNTVTINLVSHF